MSRRAFSSAVLLLASLLATACADRADDRGPRTLTIYSGRNEKLIAPLLDEFRHRTGVTLQVRYASTSELTATLLEEGRRSPAAAFISQDAGALGALSRAGLLRPMPAELLERVPARFRSQRDDWVGLSGRARVVVYNTERVDASDLPQTLVETTDERYRGRFGVAPGNASFQAHMAAYLALNGEGGLRELLSGMAANKPRIYPKNVPIVQAVIAGEIDWGLVNHYYLVRELKENPDAPARNYLMPGGGGSDFVNVSGVALLSDDPAALELVRFLLSETAQRYFVQKTFEYPLVPGSPVSDDLPPLNLDEPQLDYAEVSDALEPTLALIQESGLTRFQ